jgi:predicted nucleotidyltransferase component of viral defense system
MITKAHITRRAAQDNVPAKTVERDYVLAHVIAGIAALGNDTGLVFKGGTALRLCHFDDYRYSADLDFSLVSGSMKDGYEAITRALVNTDGSIQGLHLTDDEPPRLAYVGPLGRERTLKLDLADDEMVLSTERQRLLPRWPDLPEDASVHVYTLLEIAGEKLRCVLQRLQCRDLYDLFLLFEEAQVDATEAALVFRPKAEHRGIDPDAFAARYRERIDQYRKRWDVELREHVPGEIPHFGDVERRVTRHLRRAGLL